ncbi:helix-turn-helix transcriptional regulator [Listeria booriae]|uniref:helix-turn-helix transcriptional regulator n=1 Tax=Listeria booriae TaxID=1552123 RepID=UPI001629A6BF|nr:YafY family protein [Listeria booriae]MBC1799871.1 YafY family transcriptional regulator [Listeria booriae]
MKIDRLLEILILLMNRKHIQAKELASRFEVSTRTIYRDIETLSLAGIPVQMTRGRSGGISLMSHFTLAKIPVTPKEKHVIQLALQNLKTTHFPEINPLMQKFTALWEVEEHDWIVIDPAEYGAPPERNELFDLMKYCILEQRKLAFTYHNSNRETTTREIAPIKLWYRGNAWYVFGYCFLRQAYRLFHVHRISDPHATTHFEPMNAENIFTTFREQATTPAPKIDVTLEFSNAVYYRLLPIFPVDILEQKSGYIQVKTKIPKTDWLYSFLLSFGPDVKIVAPEELRVEIQTNLEKAIQNYQS